MPEGDRESSHCLAMSQDFCAWTNGETTTNMMRIALGKNARKFNPDTFLATIGEGRKIVAFQKKQKIFTQGEKADSIFYIQKGKARLTVVSAGGKEATIGIVTEKQF